MAAPLLFVADGLVLLPVLLEVLSLEDDEAADDVEDGEDEDWDEVACNLALLKVEFVVDLVVELEPDMVMFAMLPELIVEFMLEPVLVELPEEPVELLLDLDPGTTTGAPTPLFELEEAVEDGEEAVAEPGDDVETEAEARAAAAFVGQVEHPPNSWSMPE